MIGMQLLKDKIDKSGYKLRYIAEQLGISYQGLLNKLNSDTEFKASEIYILYHLLNMSETERDNIFFTFNVDFNSTKDHQEQQPA